MITVLSHVAGFAYKHLGKPILFQFSPDNVHRTTVRFGKLVDLIAPLRWCLALLFSYQKSKVLSQTIDGIMYKNPVGLSAGFDKNFELLKLLPALGFGFVEGGSLTAGASNGNPRPHYQRLPESKSILVNAGLNNHGVEAITKRIQHYGKLKRPLSISVAKTNSQTSATDTGGIADYVKSLQHIKQAKIGTTITLNISCPNAYGGEPFTEPKKLEQLLVAVDRTELTQPIYIKMPIDLAWEQFDQLLQVIINHRIAGVTIGNLAKDRNNSLLKAPVPSYWQGNMSGLPTRDLSNDLISQTYQKYGQKLTIIGVGGIFSAEDAYDKIVRGASLVELITGLIYEGPQVIGQINKGLVKLLQNDGYQTIHEAIGAKHRTR